MRFQTLTLAAAAPTRPVLAPRALLVALTLLALAAAGIAAARAPAAAVDPDLARVLRCMALIKGGLALAALAGSFWRLGRPVAAWRRVAYVAGPPLMAAGAIGVWSLHGVGTAALVLHLGLFALLAAALTDPNFFADRPRRRLV